MKSNGCYCVSPQRVPMASHVQPEITHDSCCTTQRALLHFFKDTTAPPLPWTLLSPQLSDLWAQTQDSLAGPWDSLSATQGPAAPHPAPRDLSGSFPAPQQDFYQPVSTKSTQTYCSLLFTRCVLSAMLVRIQGLELWGRREVAGMGNVGILNSGAGNSYREAAPPYSPSLPSAQILTIGPRVPRDPLGPVVPGGPGSPGMPISPSCPW